MEILSLTIGIKNSTAEILEKLLEDIELSSPLFNACRIDLHVMDLREEYAIMGSFLKERGLKDENPFLNEFDIDPFGLSIIFDVTRKFKNIQLLEPMVFVLGQKVSEILTTETIVIFQNTPVGFFRNGSLIDTFEKYSLQLFKDKFWKPNF